jgi:hypothetical protein
MSLAFILSFPILFLVVKNKLNFIKNIATVLVGKKSWIGRKSTENEIFKGYKEGVLSPGKNSNLSPSSATSDRINALYAKDFKVTNDLKLVLSNLRYLGNIS